MILQEELFSLGYHDTLIKSYIKETGEKRIRPRTYDVAAFCSYFKFIISILVWISTLSCINYRFMHTIIVTLQHHHCNTIQ